MKNLKFYVSNTSGFLLQKGVQTKNGKNPDNYVPFRHSRFATYFNSVEESIAYMNSTPATRYKVMGADMRIYAVNGGIIDPISELPTPGAFFG